MFQAESKWEMWVGATPMEYLAARKWFFACVLAAVAASSVKWAAESNASHAMNTVARAHQDVPDSKTLSVPQHVHRQAKAYAKRADILRPIGFCVFIASAALLVCSLIKREPARHSIAVILLTIAGLFQLLMV